MEKVKAQTVQANKNREDAIAQQRNSLQLAYAKIQSAGQASTSNKLFLKKQQIEEDFELAKKVLQQESKRKLESAKLLLQSKLKTAQINHETQAMRRQSDPEFKLSHVRHKLSVLEKQAEAAAEHEMKLI